MEDSGDQVPQIAVETENVRKTSISSNDAKASLSTEFPMDISSKSNISASKISVEFHSNILHEPTMKRIDSDSKFGHMETIPLEQSVNENLPSPTNISADCEELDNLPLQMNSLNERTIPTNLPENDAFSHNSDPTNGNTKNALSNYFTETLTAKLPVDPEGVEFFDTLSEFPTQPKTTSTNFVPINIDEQNDDKKDGQNNVQNHQETPPLLKFFAEDKSGADRNGKAFFDKIAEERINTSLLAINQNDSLASIHGNNSLISPTSSRECEEAWIPSEKTRQILVALVTSSPGTFSLDKSQLTMPGIIIDEEMKDPIKMLLEESNSIQAQNRNVLTAQSVSQDEEGLKKLIEAECYHAAINLTKELLKSFGQGPGADGQPSKHTPLSLRIWYTRLALLVKLKKFSLAEVESAAFGDLDKPDMYYEFYPDLYNGKRGSMVPFSFRLLLAELPQYQGNHQIALDNLFHILNIIQKMLNNLSNGCAEDGSMLELTESRKKASIDLWSSREQRVLYSILNCVMTQKDYVLAVSITKILMKKDVTKAPQLNSALGRIYLQLGDVKQAQDCFIKAASLAKEHKDANFQIEENINNALLAIALNNSEEAYKYYKQAYSLSPDNPMLANNIAVCLLYMGQLKDSLALLEKTIHNKPSTSLHDGILFNICTLYELESSRSPQKKLSMLELLSKHVGDGFNVSCLKIQPGSKT